MIPSVAETQADPVFDYNYQVSISISMFHTTWSYKIQKVLHFFVKRSSFFGQALKQLLTGPYRSMNSSLKTFKTLPKKKTFVWENPKMKKTGTMEKM